MRKREMRKEEMKSMNTNKHVTNFVLWFLKVYLPLKTTNVNANVQCKCQCQCSMSMKNESEEALIIVNKYQNVYAKYLPHIRRAFARVP